MLALDVGVAAPDAQHAGAYAADTMYRIKVARYAPFREALERQNIHYQPMVWTAFGRPHPRTTAILRTLSARIARRRGCSAAAGVYAELNAALHTELWRRVAQQVVSCWPG